MTVLPTRRDEDWRYSDLTALAEVWPSGVAQTRAQTVAAGASGRCDAVLTGDGWLNDRIEISVADGASLDGVIVQARAADAVTTLHYVITLGAGARARLDILSTGSRFGRIAVDVALGDGSDFALGGVNLGRDDATLEIVTNVRHAGPNATSRQTVRTVLDDRATGSFLGKVAVARHAQKTDAVQSVKALLLARTATANARPELEIFADDVKCAHGATVGELDANALFYLASRGIGPDEAKALLTQSFVADAFVGLEDDAAREDLIDRARAWLAGRPA
jgi:Fe-S cluster assembly protein SufD